MGEKDHRPRIHWRIHFLGNDADPQEEQYQDALMSMKRQQKSLLTTHPHSCQMLKRPLNNPYLQLSQRQVQRQTWKKKDLKAIKIHQSHKKRLSCQVPNMGL